MPSSTTVVIFIIGALIKIVPLVGIIVAALRRSVEELPKVNDDRAEQAGFPNKDVRWLIKDKCMISREDEDKINESGTVRKGSESLSSGQFKKCAVKLIVETESRNNELDILKGLNHENIVNLIEFGHLGKNGLETHLYMVMELCDCSLTMYMDDEIERDMSITSFKFVARQLLAGLGFIHGSNLIHSDIKPDNILVINKEIFKLSDFGVSRRIGSQRAHAHVTQTREGIGSDGYRSPESYESYAQLTIAADIFSLGIVLAQLISKGQHPYGPNPLDWQYSIRHSDKIPPDFSKLSIKNPQKREQLIQLLTEMISTEPGNRPSAIRVEEHKFFSEGSVDNSRSIRQRSNRVNPQ